MSLWDDDFYTTKPSRKAWGQRAGRMRTFRSGQAAPRRGLMIGVSAVVVVLLLAVIWWPHPAKHEAVPKPPAAQVPSEAKPGASGGAEPSFDDQVVNVVQTVNPAVVSVVATKEDSEKSDGASSASMSLGSGIIFDKAGEIARVVTNEHVVDGADKVEVVLMDGTKKPARVVGTDVISDLAVLEMDRLGIKDVAAFGNSDNLKAGQTAIAIGNPLGLGSSVSVGVVSKPHQVIPVQIGNTDTGMDIDVIQTDAAINEGNSGGPLVNLQGQVIGINSRKIAESGVEGLGFAIPINVVKPVVAELIKDGKVTRPFLGVVTQDLSDFPEGFENIKLPKGVDGGIVVLEVPEGPAKAAGIKPKDVIVELDGHPVTTTYELRKYLYEQKKVGDELVVTLYRDGKKKTITVIMGELKPESGK